MKIKKVPERTCIVTHDKCMKKDLLRVVRCPDGTVKVDLTGKMNGRGAYVKKDLEGMQTMRTLGRNMAWLLKCIELGKNNNINRPELEERVATNFID